MEFSWGKMLDGLDGSLDVIASVAMVIPGGQAIAVGAKALDAVVEAVNKEDDDVTLQIEKKASTQEDIIINTSTREVSPMDTVNNILNAIVVSKSDDGSIKVDNDSIMDILKIVAKSTGNGIDDKLLCMVEGYINCQEGK